MPRLLRTQLPDGVFHVTARGVEQRPIFADEDDRRTFLALLADAIPRYRWRCYAFCLMGNHYHVVVEATRADLSAGFQWLNGRYGRLFNDRHRRSGHLFGSRFASWVVAEDTHLSAACAYVLENPVRAGLCARSEDWRWSGSRYGRLA